MGAAQSPVIHREEEDNMPKLQPHDTAVPWRSLRGQPGVSGEVQTLIVEIDDPDIPPIKLHLSGKTTAVLDPDAVPVGAVKLWSETGSGEQMCNIYFLNLESGDVISRGRHQLEGKAWEMGIRLARASGYTV